MASIKKRRNKFSVVYYYIDDAGDRRQKWETFDTESEAKKRKAEIEYKQHVEGFISPNKLTISKFLEDFVELYGTKRWGPSTYDSNCGLIRNYINPIIGDMPIQKMTALEADKFISKLKKTKCITWQNRYSSKDLMSPVNIERINKLLKCAFRQAIRWQLVYSNPFEGTTLPKIKKEAREIWDAATIRKALDACHDSKLYVAMNLAFACSLRVGEILGLMWDNVHIEDADIANDNAYVYVDKELSRVNQKALDVLGMEEIIKIFPRTMNVENATTVVVLKTPKTESSVRRVWVPKTVAYIIREWRTAQDRQKEFLGSAYVDHGLVIALPNGRPCEEAVINKAFKRLKKDAELPNVVFHSLRHSSTTYKLKLNHGDLKATQGDTGHSQVDMITKIYAHILDEDRKVNAQKFEAAFYSNPDLRSVSVPANPVSPVFDAQTFVAQLGQSPELLAAIAALVQGEK